MALSETVHLPVQRKEEGMNKNIKTALIIGGVIVALLIILSVVPGLIWGGRGYGYGMMGGFGWGWLMPITRSISMMAPSE